MTLAEVSMTRVVFFALLAAMPLAFVHAAEPTPREPYGIGLEGFAYPHPVQHAPPGQ
jgi:hypothetical protein